MLKRLIFIITITLIESGNDSNVQCMRLSLYDPECACIVKEEAEEKFIAEENERATKIEEIREEIRKAKESLSFTKTLKTLAPKSINPVKFVWHSLKKFFRVLYDMTNIWTRDNAKSRLKKALKENKKDALFKYWRSGKKICEEIFSHKFFKYQKKWILDSDHRKTKERKKVWIRVQTKYNENKDKKKFWRPAKRCMAKKQQSEDKNDPNKPFDVYISAAKNYGSTLGFNAHREVFVFTKVDRSERDFWNKYIFVWQRVVHVEAYLW